MRTRAMEYLYALCLGYQLSVCFGPRELGWGLFPGRGERAATAIHDQRSWSVKIRQLDAHGPRGPPGGLAAAGATPPPPRPVINFTTNLRSPHHAGCEESTFTKIHVPLIATVRATPGT